MVNSIQQSIDWNEVTERNRDLEHRLNKLGLTFSYDEDGDTLFVTIGEGSEALTEHFADDVFIRLHPETQKIQGFVIVSFENDFLGKNKFFRSLLGEDFKSLRAAGGTINLEGTAAQKAGSVFEAVLANR